MSTKHIPLSKDWVLIGRGPALVDAFKAAHIHCGEARAASQHEGLSQGWIRTHTSPASGQTPQDLGAVKHHVWQQCDHYRRRRMIRRIPSLNLAASDSTQSTSSLPPADEQTETAAYFYFGWKDASGEFIIERQDRRTLVSRRVKGTSDSFAANWDNRENLEYR